MLTCGQEPVAGQQVRDVYAVKNTHGTLLTGVYPQVAPVVKAHDDWARKMLKLKGLVIVCVFSSA